MSTGARAIVAVAVGVTLCCTNDRRKDSPRTSGAGMPATSISGSPRAKSALDSPERYGNLPILILVETYALDVIGELAPEKAQTALKVTTRVWDGGADWKSTLRQQLGWDRASIDAEILKNWASFKEAARRDGTPPDPNAFARAFADEILKHHGQ